MPSLTKGRRVLLIMVAVFAVPYMLAWFLYLNPQAIDLGSRNHGTLISPLIGPGEISFSRADGRAYHPEPGSEKWVLMMFGASQCEGDCQKTLFTLQQIRKMMGVERARMSRTFIALDSDALTMLEEQLQAYSGTGLLLIDDKQAGELERRLGVDENQLSHHIVIADPMGNLVMLYPRDMEPKKIFADIEILFGRVKSV